jgi:hypothetical protein
MWKKLWDWKDEISEVLLQYFDAKTGAAKTILLAYVAGVRTQEMLSHLSMMHWHFWDAMSRLHRRQRERQYTLQQRPRIHLMECLRIHQEWEKAASLITSKALRYIQRQNEIATRRKGLRESPPALSKEEEKTMMTIEEMMVPMTACPPLTQTHMQAQGNTPIEEMLIPLTPLDQLPHEGRERKRQKTTPHHANT